MEYPWKLFSKFVIPLPSDSSCWCLLNDRQIERGRCLRGLVAQTLLLRLMNIIIIVYLMLIFCKNDTRLPFWAVRSFHSNDDLAWHCIIFLNVGSNSLISTNISHISGCGLYFYIVVGTADNPLSSYSPTGCFRENQHVRSLLTHFFVLSLH